MDFNSEELVRYSRHFNLSQIGQKGQKALKNASVLCVGAGGLGSPLMLYLAAAGVGCLGIVDHDTIELSNLHRQILYTSNEIGLHKTNVAKEKLAAINPNIKIQIYNVRLVPENILSIFKDYDLIADGTDNFATRYLINDACVHLKKPNFYASIYQFEGQCSIFSVKDGPCYRCLFPEQPPSSFIPGCLQAGVLGILPGMMGIIQATEIIKYIINIGDLLKGRLLIFDALSMSFRELKIERHPDCQLCLGKKTFGDFDYQPIGPSAKAELSI